MEKETRAEINDLLSKQTQAIENRLSRIYDERYNKIDTHLQRLLHQQESFIETQKKKFDVSVKDVERKLSEHRQKAIDKATKQLLDQISQMGDIVGLSEGISQMQKLVDEYLEKTMFLTEVSFYARTLDDQDPKFYQGLIKSMDFPHSWFQRRRNWSLEVLYTIYKHGPKPDPEDSNA